MRLLLRPKSWARITLTPAGLASEAAPGHGRGIGLDESRVATPASRARPTGILRPKPAPRVTGWGQIPLARPYCAISPNMAKLARLWNIPPRDTNRAA